MAKKSKKTSGKSKQDKPIVHQDLKGFDIKIDPFGAVISTVKIEDLNKFLNENVDDLKLQHLKSEEE